MKKRYPYSLFQSVCLFVPGFVFAIPVLFISDYFKKTPTANEVFMFCFFAVALIFFISIAMIINKRNGLSIAFNGRLKINRGLILLWGTTISFQLINSPFIDFITKKIFPTHQSDVHPGIIFFLGVILLGPILEELVFRGTILTGMLENYTSRKAILLTAIFFALVHGELFQVIPAFFWGLLFGYTFYKTRSIVLVILLHMTANFSSLLSYWGHPFNQPYTFLSAYGPYSWLVYSFALVGLVIGCYLLFKKKMFTKYLVGYQSDGNVQAGIDVTQN
jgi:membrane protease YdiL (CAAX protease family)